MAPATLSGVPGRPAGVLAVIRAMTSSSPALIGVRVARGATVLTRTPRGPNSAAQLRASCASAALVAE